ncbi:MAG: translation initiation factor IF-2 subunit alpha [Candidatus Aenigmarchaeota archaeon]|nr:translation initiation factor IF-2 subunit alpha [Candidatus Aenigmarchaeota archaeon]
MVRRKNKYPQNGELIIGTVKDINPYSIFVSLDEYPGRVGMIHVSEVARKWVRDIRDWAKKGQKVVCLVMNVDKAKDHVTLSLKRVSTSQRNRRLQEWKRDEKGEKLLNILAKKNKITLDKAYEEIGFTIQENFRDMLEVFEIALRKGEEFIEDRGIPKKWAKKIREIAEEKIKIKEVKVEKTIEIKSYEPDGIDIIKKALKDAQKKFKINIKYISAPRYNLYLETKEPKEGEKILQAAAEEIMKSVQR